jgi:hypothetical protein
MEECSGFDMLDGWVRVCRRAGEGTEGEEEGQECVMDLSPNLREGQQRGRARGKGAKISKV